MLKKKILSIILLIALCFTLNPIAVLANENDEDCDSNGYDPVEFKFEHINNGKTSSPMDLIKVTDDGTRVIVKNNLIPIAFNDHFTTKKYKDLNVVEFYIPCDITSNNAKCLIPAKSIVLGEISCIQQPKWGNRNAKVYITLKKLIFPNGRQFDICAKPYENGGVLKKSSCSIHRRRLWTGRRKRCLDWCLRRQRLDWKLDWHGYWWWYRPFARTAHSGNALQSKKRKSYIYATLRRYYYNS